MANITASEVNELRKITGAGMMDCKKALQEADGDREKAIDYLRKKGQKIADNRQDRDADEGAVFTSGNSKGAVLIELNCETDFVARNEYFQGLGQGIADKAFSTGIEGAEAANALELDGRLVSEHMIEAMAKIGEKIQVRTATRVDAEHVVSYIHPGARVGVLVGFTGVGSEDIEEIGKDVAMQIAAMKPVAIDETSVPADIVERELAFGRERAIAEGKPAQIIDKIAEGVLKKYYKDNTLLAQDYVKDTSMTVAAFLKGKNPNLKVKAFSRVQLGA